MAKKKKKQAKKSAARKPRAPAVVDLVAGRFCILSPEGEIMREPGDDPKGDYALYSSKDEALELCGREDMKDWTVAPAKKYLATNHKVHWGKDGFVIERSVEQKDVAAKLKAVLKVYERIYQQSVKKAAAELGAFDREYEGNRKEYIDDYRASVQTFKEFEAFSKRYLK